VSNTVISGVLGVPPNKLSPCAYAHGLLAGNLTNKKQSKTVRKHAKNSKKRAFCFSKRQKNKKNRVCFSKNRKNKKFVFGKT